MKFTPSTLISVILTTILLSSLFYVGITSSQGVYDPYADYDADGDIDIYDVVPVASSYGTIGDPTRNVTVTNWPTEPEPKTIVACENYTIIGELGTVLLPFIVDIEGYRYVSIFVSFVMTGAGFTDMYCVPSCANLTGWQGDESLHEHWRWFKFTAHGEWFTAVTTCFEVGAPYLGFRIYVPEGSIIEFTIVVYCYD